MFDLFPIDWSGIAAIVSFIMVLLTTFSLIHNKKQLKELKRQWKEQNTPIVSCSLEKSRDRIIIDIRNSSVVPAHNVKVHIDNFSDEQILHFSETNALLDEMSFEIPPVSSKKIPLWVTPFIDGAYNGYLRVTLEYSNKKDFFDLYFKEINLTTWQYTTEDLCRRIEDIKDSLKQIKF